MKDKITQIHKEYIPNSKQVFWEFQKEIERINQLSGWLPTEADLESKWFIPAKIALVHSEVSELLEGVRNKDHDNQLEEIADIFIRLFDLCSNMKIYDIPIWIENKIQKNEKRSFKHDGKTV